MNCKEGELAYYIGSRRGAYGFITRCTKYRSAAGLDAWLIAPPLPGDGPSGWVLDQVLRPLRNPGEDEQDESHAWLPPVPLPTIDPELLPEKESA